jgi:hypothetical protein
MTAIICSVAHLFLARSAALHADQRRTDEASRPNEANHLPGHPASFVRFVRTVGSPHSPKWDIRGSLSMLDKLGSIPWPQPSRY